MGQAARRALSVLLAFGTEPAVAQTRPMLVHQTEDSVRFQRMAEHNILGLIEYCRSLGLVGDGAVAAQRGVVEALPGPKVGGEVEETEGRRGMIAIMRAQVTLAESAQAQGMTLGAKCEQMALSLPH